MDWIFEDIRSYCYTVRSDNFIITFKPLSFKETKVCTNEGIAYFWALLQNN